MRVVAHYSEGRSRTIACASPVEAQAAIRAVLRYDRTAQFTLDLRAIEQAARRAPSERTWLLDA